MITQCGDRIIPIVSLDCFGISASVSRASGSWTWAPVLVSSLSGLLGTGALVTGIDISEAQIQEACRSAESLKIAVEFRTCPAEHTELPSQSFDVITASQSFLYFDKKRAITEVKRLLRPEGLFVTSHLAWLPRQDPVARASEELVLKHNPQWTAADFSGDVSILPKWADGHFRLHTMFVFDEELPFTRESWRGRLRACRGIGATLTPEQVAAFDREHDALLQRIASDSFSVLHRIDAHLMRPTPFSLR